MWIQEDNWTSWVVTRPPLQHGDLEEDIQHEKTNMDSHKLADCVSTISRSARLPWVWAPLSSICVFLHFLPLVVQIHQPLPLPLLSLSSGRWSSHVKAEPVDEVTRAEDLCECAPQWDIIVKCFTKTKVIYIVFSGICYFCKCDRPPPSLYCMFWQSSL